MKKFLIILYIIIFVALTYYVITLFVDRDFKQKIVDNHHVQIKTTTPNTSTTETPKVKNTTSDTAESETDTVSTKTTKYNITHTDCDNKCATITDKDKKEYCLQICGLSSFTQTTSNTCEDLSGLNKDYCLRDKAITQNKIDKCKEIQDGGIEKQCLNRISENFIDNIMK